MTGAAFAAAIDAFDVAGLEIVVEPEADARLRAAVSAGGVLLVGEVHGLVENALILYSLARRFGVGCIALEWPPEIKPMVIDFADGGRLDFDAIASAADGRITAGHFAVLRALAREGRLERLVLFSRFVPFRDWNDRDRDLAARLLEGIGDRPAIAAAGNLHTRLAPHREGTPMGAHVVAARPASVEVRIVAGAGEFYNGSLKRFAWRLRRPWAKATLRWTGAHAELRLPRAHAAVVPAA